MRRVIETDWAREHGRAPLAVEITAMQGSRATGGTWSRPDIVSIRVRTFLYVPNKYIDIDTFEIKDTHAIDVQAVYEALRHRQAATRSHVLLHIPIDRSDLLKDAVAHIIETSREHGIGVITAAQPGDYTTWNQLVKAQRVEPEPERLNHFIATQLPAGTRDLIAERLR